MERKLSLKLVGLYRRLKVTGDVIPGSGGQEQQWRLWACMVRARALGRVELTDNKSLDVCIYLAGKDIQNLKRDIKVGNREYYKNAYAWLDFIEQYRRKSAAMDQIRKFMRCLRFNS